MYSPSRSGDTKNARPLLMRVNLVDEHGHGRRADAHLDENGRTYFAYPPTSRDYPGDAARGPALAPGRVVINRSCWSAAPYLTEFVNPDDAHSNKGRAFFVSPKRLGEYILVDYVSGKQRRQRSRAS